MFRRLFDSLGAPDLDVVMVDGTFAKVHQHAAGALRGVDGPAASARREAIGLSRGGRTTKLVALVDKRGRMVRVTIRPGNAAESPSLPALLAGRSVCFRLRVMGFSYSQMRPLAERGAVNGNHDCVRVG